MELLFKYRVEKRGFENVCYEAQRVKLPTLLLSKEHRCEIQLDYVRYFRRVEALMENGAEVRRSYKSLYRLERVLGAKSGYTK